MNWKKTSLERNLATLKYLNFYSIRKGDEIEKKKEWNHYESQWEKIASRRQAWMSITRLGDEEERSID